MSIPLPALIFLCCVITLLIVLALLYVYLKKNGGMCCKMEGAAEEEALELLEEEEVYEGGITNAGESKPPPPTQVAVGVAGDLATAMTGDLATAVTGELQELLPEHTEGTEGITNAEDSNVAATTTTEAAGEGATGDATAPHADACVDASETVAADASVQPSGDTTTAADAAVAWEEPAFETTMPDQAPLEEIVAEDAIPQVDFIESEEAEPVAIAGKVLVQFTYMPAANKVNLTLIRIGDLPPVERGGSETVQAHLCVLPMRKQRFRTKAVPVSKGVFNETFQFIHMTKDLVESCAIRLRIYGTQRFSKRLIGEVKMPLSKLDLTSPLADEQIWKNLSPKGLVAYWYGIDEEDEPDDDDW